MAVACFSLAWAVLIVVLTMRAVRQFSAYRQLTEDGTRTEYAWPKIALIIPARNEESNVNPCVRSLMAQDYPREQLCIMIVDDGSTDATPEQALRLAAQDPRVHLIQGAPLPRGWKGKPFACWQGLRAVDCGDFDWLCFMDCDTRAEPALLRAAVKHAEMMGIDLLSLEPFQVLGTFWERVLIPSGFLLLAYSQDLRRVNDPDLPDASANGQFLLVRRRVYEKVGGHAAVRAQICEDSALAAHVKSAGYRIAVVGAEKLLSTRMYHSVAEIWEGISRNLIEMIGGVERTMVFSTLGVMLAVGALALPAWAMVDLMRKQSGIAWIALICAACGSLCLFAMHLGAAIRLRIPFWYGLLFPLGYLMGAPLMLHSIRVRARRQIVWKGRAYASAGSEI